MSTTEQLRIMSAARYEIRCLLGMHLGRHDSSPETMAAHLAYALHNDALTVLENDELFDPQAARERIKAAQRVAGEAYADNFSVLASEQSDSERLP